MNKGINAVLSEQVQALIAQAIQAPADMVAPDLAFGDLPQWDSLGHMEVMMLLEEKYDIQIDADTIAELISVPEICNYLRERGYD